MTEQQQKEIMLQVKQGQILDAYRKYQASVNYGEFVRDQTVDDFVALVYANDENAINNPCVQLQYFMGYVNFSNSNLVRNIQ